MLPAAAAAAAVPRGPARAAAAAPAEAPARRVCVVVWHRGAELRLADNELYALDEWSPRRWQRRGAPPRLSLAPVATLAPARPPAPRAGPHALRARLGALGALRGALAARGGALLVRVADDPAREVARVALEAAEGLAREAGEAKQRQQRHEQQQRRQRDGAADVEVVDVEVVVRYAPLAGTEEQQEEARLAGLLDGLGALEELPGDARCRQRVRLEPVEGVAALWHPEDLPAGAEAWRALAHPAQPRKGKARRRKKNKWHPKPGTAADHPSKTTANGAVEGSSDSILQAFSSEPDGGAARRRWAGAPFVMGDWRRAARAAAAVRPPGAGAADRLPPPPRGVALGKLPTLRELMAPVLRAPDYGVLGLPASFVEAAVAAAEAQAHERSHCSEASAAARLERFVGGGLAAAADRGAAEPGDDGSAQMSVHLALGTVSPRQVHAAVVGAGEVPGSPGWWVASHLEIRDFFAYVALALGTKLFAPSPALAVAHEKRKSSGKHGGEQGALWRSAATDGANAYRRWATGNTGLPLVDAAMRELVTTGYCSSRARQNAASVLTKDLCVDWRAGAALFQFLLADHDVGSNFGNWAYFSGVGFDPKNRHYRSISQAIKYDPCGAYVRRWLPALREASDAEALWPFDGAVPGWPEPIVAPRTQLSYPDAVERFGE